MARWSVTRNNWTPVAVADTTNMTAAGFVALQGGSSTQRSNVLEIYMGGLASASAPAQMLFARDSTVFSGATSNAVKVVALDPATAALGAPPLGQDVGSSTLPQRSSTLYLLTLGFNAFGGIVRWVAAPGEEIGILGNTASLGEVSLTSGSAGTPGLMSSHFIFEPFAMVMAIGGAALLKAAGALAIATQATSLIA